MSASGASERERVEAPTLGQHDNFRSDLDLVAKALRGAAVEQRWSSGGAAVEQRWSSGWTIGAQERSAWTGAHGLRYTRDMTIKRLDHISVVVDDLAAAIAFFTTLGMRVEGEAAVEGPGVDRVNALESVRVDIVMLRTPDGHGRLELTTFRNPKLVEIE